jgi:hypothetical protein
MDSLASLTCLPSSHIHATIQRRKNNNMVSKGVPNKTQALKSIVNLVSRLPSDKICTWLTVTELRLLLVSGGVAAKIDDAIVRVAMRYHICGQFDSRHFGNKHEKYYRHTYYAGDPTTPATRQMVSLELPSDYFKHADFQNDMKEIAAFLSVQTVDNTPNSKTIQYAMTTALVSFLRCHLHNEKKCYPRSANFARK